MKIYSAPTMHAIFVVQPTQPIWLSWLHLVGCTQPTNLQLCSNQSTNHNSWFGVRESQKILLPRIPIFVDWSLTTVFFFFFSNNLDKVENESFQSWVIVQKYKCRTIIFRKLKKKVFGQRLMKIWSCFSDIVTQNICSD